MAAHSDEIFEVANGHAIVEQYDEDDDCWNMAPLDDDEFRHCANGWYWQHRRIGEGDMFGDPFGPLNGPFKSEAEARADSKARTETRGAGLLRKMMAVPVSGGS